MSRVSKSRAGVVALCASTLMLVGTATAHADIAVTSPAQDAYINDITPTVTFSGATSETVVNLEVDGDVVGTTNASITGSGAVTSGVDVSSDTNNRRVQLVVRESPSDAFATTDVYIDQIPSLSGPADGTTHRAASIVYTVTDAIPGNDVVLYDGLVEVDREQADGDGEVAELKPTTALSPGAHTLNAVTVDDAGVESSPETITLNVDPPPAGFTDLFDTVQLNQRQPTLRLDNVYAGASAVTLYEIDDNGNLVVVPSTSVIGVNGTATITPTLAGALSDGQHSLVAKQTVNGVETDDDQGYLPATLVYVNTSAPTLSSNDDGKLTNQIPYFNVEGALESSGNDSHTNLVELYIDGVLAASDGTDGGGQAGLRPETLADGVHTAYVVTRDDLGHLSTVRSNEVTFTLDATAPSAPTYVSPTNGATLATSLPQITVNAEPGSLVHILVDDVGEESWQLADANGNATFTLTQALADGAHYAYVFAKDTAENYSDYVLTTFTVTTAVTPPPVAPTPPAPPAAPPTAPKNQADLDGDGIENTWLVNGKPAAAPKTPKTSVSSSGVKLTLPTAPKGAKSIRVFRADGKGGYKLVKTLKAGSKSFTDSKVKAGKTYKYKTVAVNAKGQQGKASGTATAKVKKK